MSAFTLQLDVLNTLVTATFGSATITYQQRSAGTDLGSPVTLTAIPIDPLRLEKQANGSIAVRWVQTAHLLDWLGASFQPQKGDIVTLAAATSPWPILGGPYTLIQIQEDVGGGVHLVLERRNG